MENKIIKHDQSVGAEPLVTPAGSSRPTNDETDERNPLLMEDILDNVFKYTTATRDIMNARLVCKTWRQNATKLLEVPLAFPANLYGGGQGRAEVTRFRRYLDTMNNSELVPFKNYTISSNALITTETEEEDEESLMEDFLRICGSDVVSLELKFMEWSKVGRNLRISNEVKLPKLKKLNISIYPLDPEMLNNLQEFYLLAGLILDSTSVLQKLKLAYCNDYMLFKRLSDKGLQLKELILMKNVKPNSMEESEIIQKFLQTQTATLQRLEIWNGYSETLSCSLTFPMLQQLVHLKLGEVKIVPFVVDEMFPKLRCLDVRSLSSERLSDITVKKPLTSLKELWLPTCYPSERLKKLSVDFPLITELHVDGGGGSMVDVLEQVVIQFPLLKHLELIFSYMDSNDSTRTDSILCGIPADVSFRISGLSLKKLQNLKLSELQQKPSLVNLTLLEKLQITSWDGDGPSDISAQLVFLRMPNLKELKVYQYLFSTRSIKALKERIPKFIFSGIYSDSVNGEDESEDTEDSETDMEDN